MPPNVFQESRQVEIDAGRDAQAAHLARFTGAPAPRTVPARVLNFLEKEKGADYAIARLRLETRMLDELEVEIDAINSRRFKFMEADQSLRVNLFEAKERRADTGVFERDLKDNADR